MKKSLVALAALAATGAFAQSSVTLSGDLSFGMLTNTARTAAGVISKTTAVDAIDTFNSNRINVTAVEDLGGGMKLTGRVDNRLTANNNARNSGDMFVQLDAGFGSVKIGQYTFASHAAWNSGASRTVSAVATTAQSISANVVSYTTPNIAGITVSAAYDPERSVGSAGRDGWGLKANYAAGPIGAQLSYTLAPKDAAAQVASRVTGLAFSYDFGVAKVFYNQTNVRAGTVGTGAGLNTTLGATNNTTRSGLSLSAVVPVGAASFKAGYMNNKGDATTLANVVDRATIGVDYALSKRTTLIAEAGQDKQAVTGANRATNSFVGISHTF